MIHVMLNLLKRLLIRKSFGHIRVNVDTHGRLYEEKVRRGERKPANRFYRKDLGLELKSSMEANVLRFYREWCPGIQSISYEPDTFYFPPRNGVSTSRANTKTFKRNDSKIYAYVPDFRISDGTNTWYVEVKGVMDYEAYEKARLMAKYYPRIRIFFITSKEYNTIRKLYSKKTPYWE